MPTNDKHPRSTSSSPNGAKRTSRASDIALGYGRPPATNRFKPGSSGNPKGRPKGSKNLKTVIKETMTAKISIQEGSSNRRVSKIEGVVLRQLQSALKGSDRAAMAVVKLAMQLGFLDDPNNGQAEDNTLSPADERILEQLRAEHHKDPRR